MFLTTERLGAIFVYDITDPSRPAFQSVVRAPQPNPEDGTTRLISPEGITYARWVDHTVQASPVALSLSKVTSV